MAIKRLSSDDHVDGTLVNLGNVGIGTSSPSTALDVVGAGKFSNGFTVSAGGMAIGTTIDNDVPLKIGTVSATGQIGLHLNSATGSHLQLTDSGNVDMSLGVLDGQSALSFHTGRNRQSVGTELMRLTSSGKVGIATTSPNFGLHLQGVDSTALMVERTANDTTTTNTYTRGLYMRSGPSTSDWGIAGSTYSDANFTNKAWWTSSGKIAFGAGGANPTHVVIDTNGNVGIGTGSPGYKLDVSGDIRVSTGLYWAATDKKLYTPADGCLEWFTHASASEHSFAVSHQGAKKVVLNTNGDSYLIGGSVGIGTTTPATTLHVSTAAYTGVRLNTTNTGGSAYVECLSSGAGTIQLSIAGSTASSYGIVGALDAHLMLLGTTGNLCIGTDVARTATAGHVKFFSGGAGAERMRIDGNGNVGIGTTSPAEKLHINGNVLLDNQNGYYIKNNVGTSCRVGAVDSVNQLLFGDGLTTSMYFTAGQNIYFNANGAYRGNISTSGNWRIGDSTAASYQLHLTTDSAAKPTSNTWTISSDARVKEIVGPYTRGVADIMALQPKQYRLNGAFGSVDDGRVHVSVIAQEAQATWPEMIGTYDHTDKDADDVETVTELLNLNTNELQWALVNAIKELTTRIATLEQRV